MSDEKKSKGSSPGGRPKEGDSAPGLAGVRAGERQPARPQSQVRRGAFFIFLTMNLGIILYLSFRILRPFLETFIVAAATASLSYPIFEWITRKLGGRGNLGATATVLLLVFVIAIPITLYSSILSKEAIDLTQSINAQTIQEYFHKAVDKALPDRFDVKGYLESRFGPGGFFDSSYFGDAVNRVAGWTNKLLQGFVTGVASALLNFVLFFLFLFFLLRDGKDLGRELMILSPFADSADREIFGQLLKTTRAILIGGVVVPVAQGILAMIGFAIFGMPSPILWGSILIVGAVIPIVGSTSVWVPATIYLALTGETWQWVGQLIYCVCVISSSDNIIKPVILREAANFHPLIAFVSVLGGMFAFGVFGFIVGPVVASLLLSLIRIYKMEVMRIPVESGETSS